MPSVTATRLLPASVQRRRKLQSGTRHEQEMYEALKDFQEPVSKVGKTSSRGEKTSLFLLQLDDNLSQI